MGLMKKRKTSKKPKPYKYHPKEWDEAKAVTVTPEKQPPGISTSIRLPKAMVNKLRRVAKRKGGVGYQTLLKIWIAERLVKETA